MAKGEGADSGHSSTGETVRAARAAAGLTLTEMAERIGCSAPYLSRIEHGERQGSRYFHLHLAAVIADLAAQRRSA